GLGKHQEAIEVYRNMTINYPELPEPWNNLAAEYVQLGQLDMARDALEMALNAHPDYAPAHNNMGQVQLLLAERAFRRANDLGQKAAGDKAEQTRRLFD
ncbi:MAG TPA: tetratricopeptide repeat protein, partial [Burkholderiaceae bacterium]|nr:tetratricopeptide repeat protein [Burkholderiaceae bacterium]